MPEYDYDFDKLMEKREKEFKQLHYGCNDVPTSFDDLKYSLELINEHRKIVNVRCLGGMSMAIQFKGSKGLTPLERYGVQHLLSCEELNEESIKILSATECEYHVWWD